MLTKKVFIPKIFVLMVLLHFFVYPFLYPLTSFADERANQHFQAGISCFDQEDYNQALASFLKVIQEDPNYAEAYYNIGVIYDLQGKFSEAIKVYESVISIDPNMGAVLENLAQDYYAIGQIKPAMNYLKLAESKGRPIDKAFYNQLWAAYKGIEAGKEPNKASPGQKPLSTIPAPVPSVSPSAPLPKELPKELAHIDKDLTLAIISLEKELEQKAGDREGLITLGIRYRQRGEIKRAIDVFTKALSLNINNMMVYAELGLCYYFQDQIDLFVQNFGKAKKMGFVPSKSLDDLYLQ